MLESNFAIPIARSPFSYSDDSIAPDSEAGSVLEWPSDEENHHWPENQMGMPDYWDIPLLELPSCDLPEDQIRVGSSLIEGNNDEKEQGSERHDVGIQTEELTAVDSTEPTALVELRGDNLSVKIQILGGVVSPAISISVFETNSRGRKRKHGEDLVQGKVQIKRVALN
ncbi:hypothetical protein JOM56_013286 [Amanita muscaria]